jgi:hypothetical protein
MLFPGGSRPPTTEPLNSLAYKLQDVAKDECERKRQLFERRLKVGPQPASSGLLYYPAIVPSDIDKCYSAIVSAADVSPGY